MKAYLIYLPMLNILVLPILVWVVKHEKEHTRIWLLIKQVCQKMKIESGS